MNGLLSINRGTYYMIFLGNAGYNLCIDNIMIRSKLLLFKGLMRIPPDCDHSFRYKLTTHSAAL